MRRARRGAWVVGMVLGIVAPAAGYDLTGTWEGRATCTSLFEGAKHKFADAPSIRITQTDDALGLRADYGNGDVDFYVGVAYPDAKKPDTKGELGLVACGTDDVAGNAGTFDEVGRFSVTGFAAIFLSETPTRRSAMLFTLTLFPH